MTPIIIFSILSAICTLYLIAPVALTHKYMCYILIVSIPVASLGIYVLTGSPALSSKPAGTEHIAAIKEERALQAKVVQDQGNVKLISQLAAIYMAGDRLEEAIELLRDAFTDNSENKDIQLQLATAYFAKGLLHAERAQKKQALELLQKAYITSPKDAPFLSDIIHFMDKVRSMD